MKKPNPMNPKFGCGTCNSLSMEGIDTNNMGLGSRENRKESIYPEKERASSKVISLF